MKKKIGIAALIIGLLLKLKILFVSLIIFTPIDELAMTKIFNIPLSTALIIIGIILIMMNGGKKR